jgi:hypothetical protein
MPKGVGHPVAMTRGAARFLGFVAWGSKFERPKTLAPSLDRDAVIKDCSERALLPVDKFAVLRSLQGPHEPRMGLVPVILR